MPLPFRYEGTSERLHRILIDIHRFHGSRFTNYPEPMADDPRPSLGYGEIAFSSPCTKMTPKNKVVL